MRIYIAFKGDYDERAVVGVFTTKAEAELYSIAMAGYGPDVECRDVWEVAPPKDVSAENRSKLLNGYQRYLVTMADDSEEVGARNIDLEYPETAEVSGGDAEFTMWAKSKKQAVKIASDKRAQAIVERERGG